MVKAPCNRKLLVLFGGQMLDTETGEIESDLLLMTRIAKSSTGGFIVGSRLYGDLAIINEGLQFLPRWRMRISHVHKLSRPTDDQKRQRLSGRFYVDYFAFQKGDGKHTRTTIRWQVMNLELFRDPLPESLSGYRECADALLDTCDRRGVKFRYSRGSLGGALLKASPLWVPTRDTKRRGPAPAFINAQARAVLPGNMYSVKEGYLRRVVTLPRCLYVDQSAAHHNIAATIDLPHPEHIRARGHSRQYNIDKTKLTPWVTPQSAAGQVLMTQHVGLVYAEIQVGHIGQAHHLYPPWAQKPGKHRVWLWTPELRLFSGSNSKLEIIHFMCAMTSCVTDLALKEYAQWALTELALPGREYRKSTLLSAYGMLAMDTYKKPMLRYWGGSEPVSGPSATLPVLGKCTMRELTVRTYARNDGTLAPIQAAITNVAARGVIEAETRTRSIEYARELEAQGIPVVQIYADGLVVHTDQMPFMPDGWRVSHQLTNVQIPRPNGILSDQIQKLPGMDRRARELALSARLPFAALESHRSELEPVGGG